MAHFPTPPKLITPGIMARALGQPLHRVLYVLSTRPHIQPIARAGTLRLYQRQAVTLVGQEIQAIDARQQQGVAQGVNHV